MTADLPPHQQQAPIEADNAEDDTEFDTEFDGDESVYTASLKSSLLQTVSENGRAYAKYRDRTYLLPDDEQERERLEMQHIMFLKLFNNRLILAPLDPPPTSALDLGTGTGTWAVEFADLYPECNVLGVDLSPMQPAFVPPNCKFEIDDFDLEWTYKQRFSVIHGRLLMSSMSDPQSLFKKAYDNLAPGGVFEMQDIYMPILSDDDSIPRNGGLHKWSMMMEDAVKKMGRSIRWAEQYKQWMQDLGFQDVKELKFKVPINTWPKDKFLKELGRWNLLNMTEGLPGFTIRLFNKVLGLSMEEIEQLMSDVKKDLYTKRTHSYWPIYVVYGRKPS